MTLGQAASIAGTILPRPLCRERALDDVARRDWSTARPSRPRVRPRARPDQRVQPHVRLHATEVSLHVLDHVLHAAVRAV